MVGVTEADAKGGFASGEGGVVVVIPVEGATGAKVGAEGFEAAPLVGKGAGVLKIVTFAGGGVISVAGFSRVHPLAAIANNAIAANR